MTYSRFYFGLFSLIFLTGLISSGQERDSKQASLSQIPLVESTKNTTDIPKVQKVPKTMFVIAPKGLSLRKNKMINSERLLVMRSGTKVSILEDSANDSLTIENIPGEMYKIEYDGNVGYSFSGFLSPFPLRNNGESIVDYADRLKKIFPEVSFTSKRTNPDFHEGIIDTFRLPARNWSEAFYLAFAMYQLPKSFGFPNPQGVSQETIENPIKPNEAWSSFMTVTRQENKLESIEYAYRAEGFGYRMLLTKPGENFFEMEYLSFVD